MRDFVKEITHRIADPGSFLPRGDNYNEPITQWGARAVAELFKARIQVCTVCWTNSYEPCNANDPGAQPYQDGTGHVSCSMCQLIEGLRKLDHEKKELEERLGHIASILKEKRESDNSTIHAGNTAFISMERWANLK